MRFHRDVFWPASLVAEKIPQKAVISYTHHALKRAEDKGFELPEKVLDIPHEAVFELEIDNGIKFAVRLAYDLRNDIILVLRRNRFDCWVVVTTWLNAADDNHFSLRREEYDTCLG